MPGENIKTTDDAQIRTLIDHRGNAVGSKDVDALMSTVARVSVSYDVVDPLQYVGSDEIRKRAEEWFSSFESAIGFEVRDLSIAAGDDVAFSHCVTRVSGTTKDGKEIDMWLRTTTCYRKLNDKWMVTHEHNSVPFDVSSGKASLDLTP
ncbi:MAG: YybH family protein [Gemmatimonadaceae bacterium]